MHSWKPWIFFLLQWGTLALKYETKPLAAVTLKHKAWETFRLQLQRRPLHKGIFFSIADTFSGVSNLPITVITALVLATPSTLVATHSYMPSSSFFTLSMVSAPSPPSVIPAVGQRRRCQSVTCVCVAKNKMKINKILNKKKCNKI